MRFQIEPYEGPLPIRFMASEREVVELLGEPNSRSTNFRGDRIFDYEFLNVGFDEDRGVTHIGFLPGSEVTFGNLDVFESGAFEELMKRDSDPVEVVGLILLLNLGIAFSGFHDNDSSQKAVAVFVRGAYDRLKGRMKPFCI
jgi:hypothetical protein